MPWLIARCRWNYRLLHDGTTMQWPRSNSACCGECGTAERAVLLESRQSTNKQMLTNVNSRPMSLRALMPKQKIALLVTMYLSYVMAIFSSSSFEVSMPAALDDQTLGLNQTDFALALSAGQVATVVGKPFCGFVVDMRGAALLF